ncbi:cytochrome P450 [Aspergillus brunneoviolaceus CBS 621.78]|uniref:Cytochrome P450 n=1 Tax=Aspergillus brunneoviolaceus CBS 621.78 TaxID=1450534 RepID=A0ACD1GL47_9EURO|nr:cytochrome P450 [Aspergillus brunneoviolaceus CBS 621.78]RAH49986.1 cytochrome P450 [Aspergillus brunneoviolaceus CBS 621.78]
MIGTLTLAFVPLLLFYLYRKLQYHRFTQLSPYPQPQPSLVWGHLKTIHEFMSKGEPERHIDEVLLEIKAHLNHPPLFVLDLRPVQYPLCVIGDHEVAEQISRSSKEYPYSMTKSPTIKDLHSLIGMGSIIAANGEEWKTLRRRFNPGFAPQHLMTLLPRIVAMSRRFVETLDRHAKSGVEFRLDEPCINLTFDIIGAIVMDTDFRAQCAPHQQSEVYKLFRDLVRSYPMAGGMSWESVNLWGALKRRRLTVRFERYLRAHISQKFADLRATPTGRGNLQDIATLDDKVLTQTSDQLKSFLFAGYDTTSIVLQWTFYELSRTPCALQAVRAELATLFGPDPSPVVVWERLTAPAGEHLLNQMPYTSAVIREVLRLHPPSGSARFTAPGTGFTVQLPGGEALCLDGMVVYNCETLIHRDEAVYGATKDVFRPERWLESSDHEKQKIPASAWRAFERGPRNCIGQELATLEVRVILACTVRRYEITKVGLGEVVRDEMGQPVMGAQGQFAARRELFNTMQITAKPVDGTRVRVALAAEDGAGSV